MKVTFHVRSRRALSCHAPIKSSRAQEAAGDRSNRGSLLIVPPARPSCCIFIPGRFFRPLLTRTDSVMNALAGHPRSRRRDACTRALEDRIAGEETARPREEDFSKQGIICEIPLSPVCLTVPPFLRAASRGHQKELCRRRTYCLGSISSDMI